ncbi:hypothetical protein C5167_044621 [Papaver somniferum]|uniref:Uncharacterized protein n=1 Tax=Papaver somniferum TaxID=3469 RepID=A0A4Y7LCY4_PAPSO|nr:hypothetical protein C5167_044621 [Papaver somniferum]
MASSTNRFGLVLLILVASTTFFPGKAQADYWSCMWSKQRGTFETLRTTTIGARWGEASVTFTSETLQKLEASNRNTSNMLTIKSTETMNGTGTSSQPSSSRRVSTVELEQWRSQSTPLKRIKTAAHHQQGQSELDCGIHNSSSSINANNRP